MSKATAKNEIQVVLQEYLGNRKAAKVAETVYAVIQKETQHTHNGKTSEQFYEEIKNIRSIGNNINQIARIANAKGVVDVPHLKKEIDKLDEFIIDMKNKYLRPDKDE